MTGVTRYPLSAAGPEEGGGGRCVRLPTGLANARLPRGHHDDSMARDKGLEVGCTTILKVGDAAADKFFGVRSNAGGDGTVHGSSNSGGGTNSAERPLCVAGVPQSRARTG